MNERNGMRRAGEAAGGAARRAIKAFAIAAIASTLLAASPLEAADLEDAKQEGHGWFDVMRGRPDQFSVRTDNDFFIRRGTDRYYTNGIRLDLSYFGRPYKTRDDAPAKTNFGIAAGQEIYTPSDISVTDPAQMDRPYAGWLYAGFFKETIREDEDYERWELDIGAFGPESQADYVQTNWHHLIGIGEPQGWDSQMSGEMGIQLRYSRMFGAMLHERLRGEKQRWLDIAPLVNAEVGNVFIKGGAGFRIRAGWLRSYYDSNALVSSLVEERGGGNADAFLLCLHEAFFFVEPEGLLVLHNSTIEGGLFTARSPVHARKSHLVGKVTIGVSVNWRSFSLHYRFLNLVSPELWWDEKNFYEDIPRLTHKYGSLEFVFRM